MTTDGLGWALMSADRGPPFRYVLRIPNSGGALIDGKPYADAIRNNPHNPVGASGRYLPSRL